MPRSPASRRVAQSTLGAILLSACAVFDVFEPAGSRQVVFQYTGVTQLRVGDRAPFAVTVLAEGAVVPRPRLRIAVLDSTIVALAASGDTLVARKAGRTDLHIRLEHSLLSGDLPDTTIALHVSGGGPPGQ